MASFTHQDFEAVTFHKRGVRGAGQSSKSHKAQAARQGNLTTEKKYGAGGNTAKLAAGGGKNLTKLDADTETLKHAKVSMGFRQALQAARVAKKMTQKELATAINMKPQIVQEYESGKAIPNPQLISKMERALGCKLPRDKKRKVPKKAQAKA